MNRMNPHLRQRKINALMIVTSDGEIIEPDLDFYDAMLRLGDDLLDDSYAVSAMNRSDRDSKKLLAKFEHDVELLAIRISRMGYSMPSVRFSLLERCFSALGFVEDSY